MRLFKILPILFLVFSLGSCQQKSQQSALSSDSPAPSAPAVKTPYTDLSPKEFARKMSDKDVVVLDVRTPEETAQGKIEGAIEVNVSDPGFTQKINELDKDKTYLVYCRSGRRSVTACNTMAGQGFGKLYNLAGGYMAWEQEVKK